MNKDKTISWLLVICLLFSLVGCNGDDEIPTEPDEYNLGTCSLSYLIDILEQVGPQGAIINYNTSCTFEVNSIHNEPFYAYGITYSGVGLPPIEVPITINGLGNVTFTRGENSEFLRFFYVTETGKLYLNNINLENGCLPPDEGNNKGGAILNLGGLVELTDCELVNNSASSGGAIYNNFGFLKLWNTTLSENLAVSDDMSEGIGGAIFSQGLMDIEDNTRFQSNTATNYGGAIAHISKSTFQIDDAVFSGNTAGEGGGAISAYSSDYAGVSEQLMIIHNCLFENNIAADPSNNSGGGAILTGSGEMKIHESQFINNQADWGGAVSSSSGTDLSISASILENNHADFHGGAVDIMPDSTATFAVNSIVNNIAGSGGGIYNRGTTTIDRTTIDQNQAVASNGDGGGIASMMGNLTITYSTISNNTAAGSGGGIRNNNSNLVIFNSTLSGNQSNLASAIGISGQVYISHSTIAFNYVESSGSAVGYTPGGLITVKNSIIANNTGGSGNCGGTVDALGDNLDDDGTCGFSITADPRLDSLADNGGDTLTHEILFLSPARDAVTDCTDIGGSPLVDMDQREISRPQDDACDIGAYEREALLAPITPPISTVVFLQNSSCRERPGSEYHATGFFNSGDTAEVTARNPNFTWFQVMIPDSESKCWVWKELVTLTGEMETIPIIAPEVAEVSGQDEVVCQPPDGGCPYKEVPTCWDLDTCSCVPCE